MDRNINCIKSSRGNESELERISEQFKRFGTIFCGAIGGIAIKMGEPSAQNVPIS